LVINFSKCFFSAYISKVKISHKKELYNIHACSSVVQIGKVSIRKCMLYMTRRKSADVADINQETAEQMYKNSRDKQESAEQMYKNSRDKQESAEQMYRNSNDKQETAEQMYRNSHDKQETAEQMYRNSHDK
jgi:hypothetical protein